MMELINELPNEIQFNVIKFMRHPLAQIIKEEINEYETKTESDDSFMSIDSFCKWWRNHKSLKIMFPYGDEDGYYIGCHECGGGFIPNDMEEQKTGLCRDCSEKFITVDFHLIDNYQFYIYLNNKYLK